MGHVVSTLYNSPLVLTVKTGDRKHAGTDSDIWVRLRDENGVELPAILLDNMFTDDLERNRTNTFRVPSDYPDSGPITTIEIVNETKGIAPDWFVDTITVTHRRLDTTYNFPIYRWIRAGNDYVFRCFDTSLPQLDPHIEQRRRELKLKREVYTYRQKKPGVPVQVDELPDDEAFGDAYKLDIAVLKLRLLGRKAIMKLLSLGKRWDSLEDLQSVYRISRMLPPPMAIKNWRDDAAFAAQRLSRSNHSIIKRCDQIPANFAVTQDMLAPLIEGATVDELIKEKRLYICDLKILDGFKFHDVMLCAPLALFFVNSSGILMPLAIQLYQTPSDTNPVFLPTDNQYTWLAVKMWYNNADLAYHQSLTHLAFTHLVMESVAVCSHRNISPSHPIFKLLAPHFFNIMAINSLALDKLVSRGGWIDKTMVIGAKGLFEIIAKAWQSWRLDVEGTLPNELKSRGVDDTKFLPNYHYRKDALMCYEAIKSYVTEIVDIYYVSDDTLTNDVEIQSWVEELTKPADEGGCGIKGVPGKGRLNDKTDLILLCSSVIYISSVGHAAANFYQYEDYAFVPFYPAWLHGTPPANKDELTEKDIVNLLPTKEQTFDMMVVTKILSSRGTRPLGDFEIAFAQDPPALDAVKRFQENMKKISEEIRSLNATRTTKFTILDPAEIPNSISI